MELSFFQRAEGGNFIFSNPITTQIRKNENGPIRNFSVYLQRGKSTTVTIDNNSYNSTLDILGYSGFNAGYQGTTAAGDPDNLKVYLQKAGMTQTYFPAVQCPIPVIKSQILCNGGNGTLEAAPAGGTGTLSTLWTGGATSLTVHPGPGTYSYSSEDSIGCSATSASVTLDNPSVLQVTLTPTFPVCAEDKGRLSAIPSGGRSSNYTYSWSNGMKTRNITNLVAGVYSVSVSNEHNCSAATASFNLTAPPLLRVSATSIKPPTCFGFSDGSFNAQVTQPGSGGGYMFSVNNTFTSIATFRNLVSGNYTLRIRDSNGCVKSTAVALPQPTPVQIVSSSKQDCSCFGSSDGMASVTASGGNGTLSYSWSPLGGTANTAQGLSAGEYQVTVTDQNGCITTMSVTILEPPQLEFTNVDVQNAQCNGERGSISFSVEGGVSPLSVGWIGTNTGSVIGNETSASILPDEYTITLSDSNGCSISTNLQATEPPVVEVSINIDQPIHGSNGNASITVTNAVEPIVAEWTFENGTVFSNGVSVDSIETLCPPADITVTITDNNGCQAQDSVTIVCTATSSPTPSPTATPIPSPTPSPSPSPTNPPSPSPSPIIVSTTSIDNPGVTTAGNAESDELVDESKKGLSGGAIAGIVIAILVVAGAAVAAGIMLKKKGLPKRKSEIIDLSEI